MALLADFIIFLAELHLTTDAKCTKIYAKMYIKLKTHCLFAWIHKRKDTFCQKISLNQTFRNVFESELRMR